METPKNGSDKWFAGRYHDGRIDDKVAYGIRLAVLMVMLLTVFFVDRSDFLVQLSKWHRRAVLLLGGLTSMELCYLLVIKIWLKLSDKTRADKSSEPEKNGGGQERPFQ